MVRRWLIYHSVRIISTTWTLEICCAVLIHKCYSLTQIVSLLIVRLFTHHTPSACSAMSAMTSGIFKDGVFFKPQSKSKYSHGQGNRKRELTVYGSTTCSQKPSGSFNTVVFVLAKLMLGQRGYRLYSFYDSRLRTPGCSPAPVCLSIYSERADKSGFTNTNTGICPFLGHFDPIRGEVSFGLVQMMPSHLVLCFKHDHGPTQANAFPLRWGSSSLDLTM